MSEASLNRRLRDKLGARLWWRVENVAKEGTPDVWCVPTLGVSCWIELKHVDLYPKRPATPIRFKRFTLEQVRALEAVGREGGSAWLLVQVEDDHYLFGHEQAGEVRDGRPKDWWLDNAPYSWMRRLNYPELLRAL